MSESKDYTISFTDHPEYLYVHLSGESISERIIRDYISAVVEKSNAVGKDRILLYRDIPAALPEGSVYHSVSESLDALRGKKLALVNPHTKIEAEVKFGITVGQNRGGNYASFTDVDDAVAWLLK